MSFEEDFLAHYGKKGMRWGQRKAVAKANERSKKGPDRFGNRNNKMVQRKVDRVKRVAAGKASVSDKVRFYSTISLAELALEDYSAKGVAQNRIDRAKRNQAKVASGKKRVTDKLLRLQGIDVREIKY